jgi:hypothetical protein
MTGEFCHQALFYSGEPELVPGVEPFVREGLEAGDRVLVVLSASTLGSLRKALDRQAAKVSFADRDLVGANPASIIPLWKGFLEKLAPGEPARGVGEPVSPSRAPAELAECQIHESLLNVAFAYGPPLWLLCPYDTTSLDKAVVEEARRSHPLSPRTPSLPLRASTMWRKRRGARFRGGTCRRTPRCAPDESRCHFSRPRAAPRAGPRCRFRPESVRRRIIPRQRSLPAHRTARRS